MKIGVSSHLYSITWHDTPPIHKFLILFASTSKSSSVTQSGVRVWGGGDRTPYPGILNFEGPLHPNQIFFWLPYPQILTPVFQILIAFQLCILLYVPSDLFQCKYTAKAPLQVCKEERHTLKWHEATQRFFKCKDCKRKCNTFDRFPSQPCR